VRIEVRRYHNGDAAAVGRLNDRLIAGNSEHRLYTEDLSVNPTSDLEIRPVNDSLFVATDGEEIHGGAWLREQHFRVDGVEHRLGWMKYPVAESLVDPMYAGVPASMVLQLLRKQPCLMGVGMGGHQGPFARLLSGARWTSSTIPLFFRIVRPFRVLRGLEYARRRWWLRVAMDAAAWTGLGWAAHQLLGLTLAAKGHAGKAPVDITTAARFTPWADTVWETCRDAYSAMAVRDARTLDYTYPETLPRLSRVRVARAGADIGWACVQTLPHDASTTAYFGALEVGLVTDALATAADATDVLAAGVRHLADTGVDLVIAYFSHDAWVNAAHRLGFFSGPSTLAFYRSPRAEQLLLRGGTEAARCHLTRSDGHGPA
jgi:hypothetical protein